MNNEESIIVKNVAIREANKIIKKIAHLQKKSISEGLLSTVESLLNIAVPLVSISGDMELTSLLASLRVWIDRKRLDQQREDLEWQRIQEQTWDSLTPTYGW
jgi:hypothetical protein